MNLNHLDFPIWHQFNTHCHRSHVESHTSHTLHAGQVSQVDRHCFSTKQVPSITSSDYRDTNNRLRFLVGHICYVTRPPTHHLSQRTFNELKRLISVLHLKYFLTFHFVTFIVNAKNFKGYKINKNSAKPNTEAQFKKKESESETHKGDVLADTSVDSLQREITILEN